VPNNNDSPSSKLTEFLAAKLLGSSLEVIRVSDEELQIKAGDDITLKILIEAEKKRITFNLFSPALNRTVPFEEINGTGLLDVRLDDELKGTNREAEEEDTMLAIDLLREWSKENKYAVLHVE
jgi:hypothetical protein